MEERMVVENVLSLVKGVSDLYMHGAIEAAFPKVNGVFKKALNENLQVQHDIFKAMETKGWYQIAEAEQKQVDQVKQKFASA